MRYGLSALLLPALLWLPSALAQDNEAEKLFRNLEKTIKAAKAIQVAAEISTQFQNGKGQEDKFKASLLLTRDNKTQLKLDGETNGEAFNCAITADGQRVRASKTGFPEPKEGPLPKKLHDRLSAMTCRLGLMGGVIFVVMRRGGEEAEVDVEAMMPVTDFKREAGEKVRGRDTTAISYTTAGRGKDKARVTLWLDAKTLLPLKRVLVGGGERITETYKEFNLNPTIE